MINLTQIRKFFIRKRIIWSVVALIVILSGWWFFFGRNNGEGNIQFEAASVQNIHQTVLATGQVASGTDLDLGFQSSGVVAQVYVKEGDKVYKGQILANLNEASALASLTSAKGTLAKAQADYDKLIAGATQEDIKTVQDAVVSAQQDLDNEYDTAKNTLNDAYLSIYNSYTFALNIKKSYFPTSDQQGIKVENSTTDIAIQMNAAQNSIAGATTDPRIDNSLASVELNLQGVYTDLSVIRDQCDYGVYYDTVTSTDKTSLDTKKSTVNTEITDISSIQQNIASYKAALQTAKDKLAYKVAPPTQADIDAAKGQITSAQGQVYSAQATLNNLIIYAPITGTITQVDIKVGQQATALSEAIILQNVTDLHSEAYVSEANIASLQLGQSVDYTFDALGPDKHYQGKILTINPSATLISGVVNYKVTGSLDNITELKPGMTANMIILVAQKDNTIVVPSSAVINQDGKQYVRVVDNTKTGIYHNVEVQVGLQADGGLTEILSGVSSGQQVVTYVKQ